MIKWETGSDKCLFVDEHVKFVAQAGNDKKKDVICSKCGTRSEVCVDGLRKIELVELSATPGN